MDCDEPETALYYSCCCCFCCCSYCYYHYHYRGRRVAVRTHSVFMLYLLPPQSKGEHALRGAVTYFRIISFYLTGTLRRHKCAHAPQTKREKGAWWSSPLLSVAFLYAFWRLVPNRAIDRRVGHRSPQRSAVDPCALYTRCVFSCDCWWKKNVE